MQFTIVKRTAEILTALGIFKAMALQRALFKIVSMYCRSCKPIVEKQLKREHAIKGMDIDIMTDGVMVEYDATLISKNEIKKRLENSGYKFTRVFSPTR